jgi:SAM-dependent methyltransferase
MIPLIQNCVTNPAHPTPVFAFAKKGTDIYVCEKCGSIMADLDFVQEQYEDDSYYTMEFESVSDIDLEWGFRWRYILSALKRYNQAPTILDVGAGNGYFVFLARKEFGWNADGVETSATESAYAARMFDVKFLNVELAEIPRTFDIVASFNVLEHVSDPAELLSVMRQRISPGGHLVLTTPNPACIQRRLKGLEKWGMVAPPHHINLFTRASLGDLLEQTGFAVVEYATLSTYINAVRKFDTQNLVLRKAAFQALKSTRLGADHFLVCRPT